MNDDLARRGAGPYSWALSPTTDSDPTAGLTDAPTVGLGQVEPRVKE